MTYHVFARGNRRGAVFAGQVEYEEYLSDLERLSRDLEVRVLSFCLMPNHPHLCLRTSETGAPLSLFIQRLHLRHAQRYNRLHQVCGHLYQSRYKAQVVDSERYLLALVRYIHQNPVRARMVPRPEDWPYSSQAAYLGQALPWVETAEVLARAGGAEGWARWMAVRPGREERALFAADKKGRFKGALGDLALVGSRRVNPGPWKRRAPERPAQDEARELAAGLGWKLEELDESGAQAAARSARREVAVALRAKGYRLHEIGRVLGREEAAISRLVMRAAECREEEAEYGAAA